MKEKLSDISNDHRGTCNKFKEEGRYTLGKYIAIHGTAAALRKIKKSHSHYRITESTVRTMRDKYHQIVKLSPITENFTSLRYC